ncbi:hypothetical protein FB479_107247 [Brevibacillus sp. AG162]|nr:hypothetical protein FB479_107247 [Brevibacillus sp. AG162]
MRLRPCAFFSIIKQALSTFLLHSSNLNVVLTFSLCWTFTIYSVKNNKTHRKTTERRNDIRIILVNRIAVVTKNR